MNIWLKLIILLILTFE